MPEFVCLVSLPAPSPSTFLSVCLSTGLSVSLPACVCLVRLPPHPHHPLPLCLSVCLLFSPSLNPSVSLPQSIRLSISHCLYNERVTRCVCIAAVLQLPGFGIQLPMPACQLLLRSTWNEGQYFLFSFSPGIPGGLYVDLYTPLGTVSQI